MSNTNTASLKMEQKARQSVLGNLTVVIWSCSHFIDFVHKRFASLITYFGIISYRKLAAQACG